MFFFKNNTNDLITNSSPILMVSADDLRDVVSGILEEVISASKDEKRDESLVTIKQASALLDVDRSTLWRWEKEGYLKPVRIGRKVRYPMYAVEAIKKGGYYERV